MVPILLALSYPAVFVAAGLSVALAPTVFRLGVRRVRLAFLVYNVVLIASFLSIYFSATVFQSSALREGYRWGYWHAAFPPWAEPWKYRSGFWACTPATRWLIPWVANAAEVPRPCLRWLVGILAMWRRGRRTPLALLLSPCVMGLAAAGLGQYPYGGAPRLTQYLAPSICLLAGLGASVVVARLSPGARRRRALALSLALLAAIGVFLVVRDLFEPYRVRGDLETAAIRPVVLAARRTRGRPRLRQVRPGIELSAASLESGHECGLSLSPGDVCPSPAASTTRLNPRSPAAFGRPARLVFFDDLPGDNPFSTNG